MLEILGIAVGIVGIVVTVISIIVTVSSIRQNDCADKNGHQKSNRTDQS